MFNNKDIVCVAFPNWEGEYMKTLVQVMEVIGEKNRLLYVNYQYTWKDVLTKFLDKYTPISRILGFRPRLKLADNQNDNIWILMPPPVFPINWLPHGKLYRFMLKLNANIVLQSIRSAMKKLEFNAPVVFNGFNPFVGLPIINKLGEELLVYYCYDEISAVKWSSKHGKVLEKEYLKKVDAVITTSSISPASQEVL